jgi:hypothetical protein
MDGRQGTTHRDALASMLRDEGIVAGETVVKEIVREWKRQRQEGGDAAEYRAGDLAEVDFFEMLVDVAGEQRKAHLFVMRLMHSERDFAWLYPRQDQTCFLDGHVRAFRHSARSRTGSLTTIFGLPCARSLPAASGLSPHECSRSRRTTRSRPASPVRTADTTRWRRGARQGIRWQELFPISSGQSLDEISGALLARET